MNREQVIAIAKSVDVRALETSDGGLGGIVEPLRTFHMSEIQLERFAAVVAAAEREACAAAIQRRIDLQRTGCKTEVEAIRCLAAIKNKETK